MNKRTKLNFCVDWAIFLCMLFVFFSGFVLWGWLRPAGMSDSRGAPSAAVQPNHPDAKSAESRPTDKPAEKTKIEAPKARIFWGLIEANTFWGMTKNGGWKHLHCWIGVAALLPLMILHLILHWKWITQTTAHACRRSAKQKNNKSKGEEPIN